MIAVLQWNPVVFMLTAALVVATIMVPLTAWSMRRGHRDPDVVQAGLTIAGGSFIFISAFVAITVWQGERDHDQLIVKEFNSGANLAEDVIWYLKAGQMDGAVGNQVLDGLLAYGDAVRRDELPEITGLPETPGARGSLAADAALQQVEKALEIQTARTSETAVNGLWESWRGVSDSRQERLSLREPLPGALLGIMIVTALATLVLLGVFPAGDDTVVRWIVSAMGGLVVVSVFAGVMLLVYPGIKQDVRSGPIDAMNAVIATRR